MERTQNDMWPTQSLYEITVRKIQTGIILSKVSDGVLHNFA